MSETMICGFWYQHLKLLSCFGPLPQTCRILERWTVLCDPHNTKQLRERDTLEKGQSHDINLTPKFRARKLGKCHFLKPYNLGT
jgi:hypothetical protein